MAVGQSAQAVPVDLTLPGAADEPLPLFREWRSRGPVLWSDHHRAWLVVGHGECVDAFRDERLSADRVTPLERQAASRPRAFGQVVDLLRGWMIFHDDPHHARLREPVRGEFTPRAVKRLTRAIAAAVDELLEAMGQTGGGDFREIFAKPLPANVIAELLGVPRSDRREFQDWSEKLTSVVFSVTSKGRDDGPAIEAAGHFGAYFGELIDHYRRNPADNLLSTIATSSSPGLSEVDLIGMCSLLLFAGHETTTELLSSATWLLCLEDRIRNQLRDGPSSNPGAADEFVRFCGPAKTMVRKVAVAHERADRRMEPGQIVYLVVLAADRDPAVFDRPDQIVLDRKPNPHLGFGWGIHYCLGAALARLETSIALSRLLARFPDLRHVGDPPRWARSVMMRTVSPFDVAV